VFVGETDEAPECSIAVFSAHGVGGEAGAARGLEVIDATCPLSTKVHNEAKRLARDDYDTLLIGHEGHDEVAGTAGARQRRLRTDAPRRWAAAWQTIRTSFRLNPTDLTTPIRRPTGPGNVRLTRRHGTDHPRRHTQSHYPPTQLVSNRAHTNHYGKIDASTAVALAQRGWQVFADEFGVWPLQNRAPDLRAGMAVPKWATRNRLVMQACAPRPSRSGLAG